VALGSAPKSNGSADSAAEAGAAIVVAHLSERLQSLLVARNGMVLEIAPHHRLQPLHCIADRLVHPLPQLRLDIFQLRCHALAHGLSSDCEAARFAARPTNVSET